MPAPMTPERRRLTLHRLACLLVALMLVVIGVSAWLRLAQPRAPCELWPLCRTVTVAAADMQAEASSAALRPARSMHRAAASSALLVVLAMLSIALAPQPRDWRTGRTAATLLLLALGLSVLGIVSAGSRALPVVLGNLFGAYAMLALAFSLTRRHAVKDAAAAALLARHARLGVLLWAAQVALGATAGAGTATPAAFVHLGVAIMAAGWAMRVGRRARGAGLAFEGSALMALAAAQWILGASAAWWGAPAALLVAHNMSAACGVALMFGLQRRHACNS